MRKIILLIITLIPQIYCFSQNISNITIEQIKTANKIFIEHQKYSKLVPLLEQKVENISKINDSWKKQDSLNLIQLTRCNDIILDQTRIINDLNKSIKFRNKIIKYGAVGSVLIIFTWLLQK